MKKLALLFCFLVLNTPLFSQIIKSTLITPKNSKEAKKAIAKGDYINAGYYWNQDQTKLFKLTVFTPKKSNQEMLEIHTVDQDGTIISTEVKPFNDEVLSSYHIKSAEFEKEEAQLVLKDYRPVYVKNPLMAGTPSLVYGSFIDRYHTSGLWVGYKFDRSEKIDLDEKFWSFVSFPLDDSQLEKNYHLLAPPGGLAKLLSGFGYRQYLNAEKTAYIGGLKATAGQDEFISGVFDLEKQEWVQKSSINVRMKLLPGQNSYERLDGKHTAIILAGKDEYKCLIVDELGRKVSLAKLEVVKSGGTANIQIAPALVQLPSNKVAVATSSYESLGGKGVGVGFSIVDKDGKVQSWNYSNDDLMTVQQSPSNHKVKLKKLKYLMLESIRLMRDGSYVVVGNAKQDKANSVGIAHVLVHISSEGKLKSCYTMESLTAPKEENLSEKMPTTLIATENGFYWIERSQLKNYEKGVYSYTDDFGTYTRTTTFRQDRTLTVGQISKVNLLENTISNAITPKSMILGDEVGSSSATGALVISTVRGLLFIQ
jgi:hypothetical protein